VWDALYWPCNKHTRHTGNCYYGLLYSAFGTYLLFREHMLHICILRLRISHEHKYKSVFLIGSSDLNCIRITFLIFRFLPSHFRSTQYMARGASFWISISGEPHVHVHYLKLKKTTCVKLFLWSEQKMRVWLNIEIHLSFGYWVSLIKNQLWSPHTFTQA
jgi:hypothetical protein